MNKRPTTRKVLLLLSLCLAAGIVYGVYAKYSARSRRAACYRVNLEKLNSLEPSTAAINAQVQEIQTDQDVIDRLDGTDDDAAIERRSRMIDGVKLKLTRINQDRAENQRRTEQIQAELSSCLAAAK